MRRRNSFSKSLLYSLFALFLLCGATAYGGDPGREVTTDRLNFLPPPDENEGATTSEVQATQEGYEVVGEEALLGDSGKPGLGGVRARQPNFLPPPDENGGATTSEVQATQEGYEVVGEEALLGDSGKPGFGGVRARQPNFLPPPDENQGATASMIQTLLKRE